MTVGVYLLRFDGTNKVYVGQSITIENRLKSHLVKLRAGRGSRKLQEAYDLYGTPKLEILVECLTSELDDIENEAISIFDSVENGFNIMSNSGHRSQLHGDSCGNAKYTNDQIIEVFLLLVYSAELTQRNIAEVTGVSVSVINDISRLATHGWLAKEFPMEYGLLETNLNTRRIGRRTAKARGIEYPTITSPDGVEYTVDSIRGFAREHNLNHSSLGKVLRGQANSHAGWALKKFHT